MPEVIAPDGSVIEFPYSMTDDQIKTVMRQKFPPATAEGKGDPDKWSAMREAGEVLTLGGAGKLSAAGLGLADATMDALRGKGFDYTANYNRILEQDRANQAAYNEQNPYRSLAGQAAGLATGIATLPAAALFKGATAAAKVGNAAITGAGYGGAAGALQDADDASERAVNTGIGTVTGGVIGLAAPAVAKGVSKTYAAIAKKPPVAPTADALEDMADSAYKRASDAGVTLQPTAFGTMVDDIVARARDTGIDPTLHPRITAALSRLEKSKVMVPSVRNIELLRRVMRSAGQSAVPDERRIAGEAVERLDDLMDNLQPKDIASGNADDAIGALKEARALWSRKRKADTVEELIERARVNASKFSGSGYENALRSEFRHLATNPKRLRTFTAEEQAAIKKVATGGKIENALRWMGRWAPTGTVPTAAGAVTGSLLGGPLGTTLGIALPVAGAGFRAAATKATTGNVNKLDDLVRRGGRAPALEAPALEEAIRRLLELRGGDAAGTLIPR